jgi:hypothetical protein
MAHFVNSSAKPIERLSVGLNTTVEIGVWGPLYPPPKWDSEYDVISNPGNDMVVDVTMTQQGAKEKPITGNIRSWSITGKAKGSAVLNVMDQYRHIAATPLQIEVTDTLIAWGQKVSSDFKDKVIEICKRLEIDPSHLMACMRSETAGTFDPHIWNGTVAVGLIQFTSAGCPAGTNLTKLSLMTAVEQLDWVEKYFLPYKGRLKTVEDVYTAMAWPAAVGKSPDYVFYTKGDGNYEQNQSLDTNHDDKVTKGELGQIARDSLRAGLLPANAG